MAYDTIIVGGGLAGASLAKSLAEEGVRALVLERERSFKDRVRGEQMHCWGIAEARSLGIYELLKKSCGHEVRYWASETFGMPMRPRRDLVTTTPHQVGSLHFYHPEMQTVVLNAAEEAGADVRRGVTVVGISAGPLVSVRVKEGRTEQTYRARLVVGADGRTSACRRWTGFQVQRDPDRMVIAGLLFEGLQAPDDAVDMRIHPQLGQLSMTIPLGRGRFRSYVSRYKKTGQGHLSGRKATASFIAASIATHTPAQWYEHAEAVGPLASFEAADTWVVHPYKAGVVLVGDAAACSDPSFGCGLSLTLRDVRVLRDELLCTDDWDAAAHAYAEQHDRYYGSLHRLMDWMTSLLYEPGPAAEVRRRRAFAGIAEDRSRIPDIVGIGPEFPSDEVARRRLFGEDLES